MTRARRRPELGRSTAPRTRSRWVFGLSIASVAALVCAVAVFAAGNAGYAEPEARAPGGLTNRGRFLLVPVGRSHAEVADLLGQPQTTRAQEGAEPGTDCWLYGSRSGLPIRYQLCFRGGFLETKEIIPAPARAEDGR